VVLGARDSKMLEGTKEGVEALVAELVAEHIIG
jgi:hypothetical protein